MNKKKIFSANKKSSFSPSQARAHGLSEREINMLQAIFQTADKIIKGLMRYSIKNNDTEIAYWFFESYYRRAGMKLERKDIPEIRLNMRSLAKKLIKDHQEEVEGGYNG